jgi:hypothetical protein
MRIIPQSRGGLALVAVVAALVGVTGRELVGAGEPTLDKGKPIVTKVPHRSASGRVTTTASTSYPLTDGNPFEIFGGFVMYIVGAPSAIGFGIAAARGRTRPPRARDCEGRTQSLTS